MEQFSGRTATATTQGTFLAKVLYSCVNNMFRLGQGDLFLRNYRVGTIWVSRVVADAAFQPRIALLAGCQFQDVPGSGESQEGPVGFRIGALGGQLRWGSKTGPVIGDLSIPKGLQHLRSAAYSLERTFTMFCDVPHHVLSRLEAERGAAPPIFWMDLSGSWEINGVLEPIAQPPWAFDVPTDMWLAFLSESAYNDFEIIELRRVLKEGGSLQPAVDQLNAARVLVASDPPKAVGICRLLVEALERGLKDQGYGRITDHLTACTDERRGREYNRIVSSLKQLASLNHHDYGRSSVFTRPEALALVRMCEAILLMAGELTKSRQAGSGKNDQE